MTQKSEEDLRVRRTRKLLQKALLEVTSEKGFANITVRDISERAMINRSTFYRHYLDKYDLLSQYLEELYSLLDAQAEQDHLGDRPNQMPEELPAGLVSLLRHIQANADFYRVMLGEKGEPTFCAQSFRRHIDEGVRRRLRLGAELKTPGSPPIDLIVNSLLHAGVGAILWWLESDQPITPEQMAVWLVQLGNANIRLSLKIGVEAEDREGWGHEENPSGGSAATNLPLE